MSGCPPMLGAKRQSGNAVRAAVTSAVPRERVALPVPPSTVPVTLLTTPAMLGDRDRLRVGRLAAHGHGDRGGARLKRERPGRRGQREGYRGIAPAGDRQLGPVERRSPAGPALSQGYVTRSLTGAEVLPGQGHRRARRRG